MQTKVNLAEKFALLDDPDAADVAPPLTAAEAEI